MPTWDLHACARFNRLEELRALIANDANLNVRDEFGATALHYAVAYKNFDVIALLLEHGADVALQDRDGSTALHVAIEYNLLQVAEELLKKNPGLIAIADKHGNEPLWTAAFNAKGNYGLVLLLRRYGADPKHRNNVNLSPVDIPKRKGDSALLRILESKEARQSQEG
jgi:ankyrin repeat protein